MLIKDIFKKHHLVIQEASFTCGPVTILNILHLKGDFSRSEKELAKLCDSKPGAGSSNANVVKTAKHVGLKVLEEKTDASIADIDRQIDNGAYVIVCYFHAFAEDGHYSVITEYDDRSLFLADSSLGFLRLQKKDFKKYWYNSDKSIHGWFAAVK